MATHSSILAWRILWTEEPGGLQSIGSQRARHDRNSWAWGLIVVTTRASQWAEKISLGRGSLLKTTWENWLLNFTPGESQGTLVCKGSEKAYACVCVCVCASVVPDSVRPHGLLAPWKKSYDQPGQHTKKQRHYFTNKGPSIQSYGFSSGHVWMWELDYKESWALKNWCFWTVVLEKTPESPLDCKEIQPVHPKGDRSWIFIGRTDAEAETPILWPPEEEPTHGKRAWCWERLKAGGEGEDRGWDGWMASPTRWTWIWVSSGSWWWTGRPGVPQSMGSVTSSWTWLSDWTELNFQASLSVGVSRQEYWSRFPFPSPGDLPHPGIKLESPKSTCIGWRVLYY